MASYGTQASYQKEYRLKNKERLALCQKVRRAKNRKTYLEYLRIYRLKYPNKYREWYAKNKISVRNRERNYFKNNLQYKIRKNIRTRINGALSRDGKFLVKKSAHTRELLGCSFNFLKSYLEKRFQIGMNWKNHTKNGWHIDHIKPCGFFDLTKPEQQKECFHYTNLQPLWAKDNLEKGMSF